MPAPKTIALQPTVEEIVDSMNQKAELHEVAIRSTFPDVQICTDPSMLRLILMNLIDNAIKFSPSGQHIHVEVHAKETELTLTVIDHGIGIDPAQIERVFDRFHQLDEGVCKAHAGHGIGLSATKALLDLIEGSIHIDSRPKQGTTCSVLIPINQRPVDDEPNEFDEFIDGETEMF